MKKEKITIFIEDGIITTAYATNPSVEVNIISFDKDFDNPETLKQYYAAVDKDLKPIDPKIIHPHY